tara:strand:+ start:253 stop:942 length:690 start_codon:yes stop_codon:yes gene_type:complete
MTKKDLINEVVGYLRVAAKKYYHGSSLYKHETDILNRLSPSARKKELEKFTKQWKSEKVGKETIGGWDSKKREHQRLKIMDAGIDSGRLGRAGISGKYGISERMMDDTYDLKKDWSSTLWGGTGVNSLNYKKQKAKQLATKLFSKEGKHVREMRLEDKRFGRNKEWERDRLGDVLSARRAGKVYAKTLKRELKHFFPNLSEKIQRQYVAKKMKGIGESIKEKRKEIGIK